jgi:hypothetical protein
LHDGQTRYLLPGQARTGAVVRCIAGSKISDAMIPNVPAGGSVGGTDGFSAGGPPISIDRRPNGATELRCGSATAGIGFFGPVTPYVIGQNGLGLIRGRNTLAALKRVFGAPSTVSHCRAAWRSIGLVATFAGASCTGASVLAGATVEGARWGSFRGVRVGDSVGRLLWQAQDAKRVAPGQWLIASGGTSHHAKLVAVTRSGKVAGFVLSGV